MHGLHNCQLRVLYIVCGHMRTVAADGLDLALRCTFVLDANGAALLSWVRCHAGTMFGVSKNNFLGQIVGCA